MLALSVFARVASIKIRNLFASLIARYWSQNGGSALKTRRTTNSPTPIAGVLYKLENLLGHRDDMKPLAGYILLDLTHMLSGPYGTMLLADLGVRTIKIEPPGAGEATRSLL